MRIGFRIFFLFLICLFVGTLTAVGQSYGLAFVSNEAVQDERTSLDLSPQSTLCFKDDFELSFEISFVPNQREYFGYIARILDNKGRNIDFISNVGVLRRELTLVIDSSSVSQKVDTKITDVFNRWNKISLRFSFKDQTLTYSLMGKKYSKAIEIDKNSCYKIIFGANKIGNFKTTDVPPMKIRDVKLLEGGTLKSRWLLNEQEGNIAVEEISGNNAFVDHPSWIKKTHQRWKHIRSFRSEGPVSVAFDPDKETLYFVGLDSLNTYSVANNQFRSVEYSTGRLNLLRGNQSYFNVETQTLHNIYLDQKVISVFDFSKRSWSENYNSPAPLTDNWQYNKFYSSVDSSFYFLTGYGHFRYKNEIKRFHKPTKTWSIINPPADDFIPRYLAALGKVKGGAYILGGYGTKSGQQIHNPKSLYDLLFFDTRKQSIKKVSELKVDSEDFVFANSLVIDEQARSYYGLIFSKHKFNSKLQLIKGSLDSGSFTTLADTIPYQFYDINSFADLYYCSKTKQYIAVTLFLNDKNQTEAAIYSLPTPALAVVEMAVDTKAEIPVFGLISAISVLLGLYFLYYYRESISRKLSSSKVAPVLPASGQSEYKSDDLRATPAVPGVQAEFTDIPHHDVIYLFGDLQLFDPLGNDITKYFTPLIKELFLVILLYSLRWERGISSEKLKELLWFDKSVESARNNRSVNIAKLKTILDNMGCCEISKETGYWKINIDFSKVAVDYNSYLNIIKDKSELNKQRIKELTAIIQRGSFLSNLDYEWLDSFKSEISNQVIDIYQHFANSIEIADDAEFLVEISNYIFYFDSVNEEAMRLKCRCLVHLGKHSLAKGAFENFRKEYKIIYGEDYGKDFHAFLE